jgi:rubrerythrin
MTKEVAEKIAKGINDKIECNTVDIDDWAEFWGFTREEYEEFLDMGIKALEQQPKTGHWILYHPLQADDPGAYRCSVCGYGDWGLDPEIDKFCFNCGADMRGEDKNGI